MLKALTGALGANMWFNCILVLTHGAAAPPDNNAGPMTYDIYANQRTHGLQQAIRWVQAGGLHSMLTQLNQMPKAPLPRYPAGLRRATSGC